MQTSAPDACKSHPLHLEHAKIETTSYNQTQATYKPYENKLRPLLLPQTQLKSSTTSKQTTYPELTRL